MNPNLAKVGKPTRWPPGQSGNPAGKPPGTRTAFSQGFIRDFALVWAEEGLEAVRKVAKKSPEAFVAIAARICPNDVRLTLEQAIPGGMSLEDYSLMREVIAAIREGLPEADQMQPGQVFQHVLGALRDCPVYDIRHPFQASQNLNVLSRGPNQLFINWLFFEQSRSALSTC